MAETFQQFLAKLGPKNKKLPRARLRQLYNKRSTQLPRELIGDPNVVGRYRLPADKIRLNPTDVRIVPNRYGTNFAVSRTDVDDLTPIERGEVKRFDTETAGQTARIQQSYAALAAQARTDSATGAQQLGDLGRLTTSGLNLPPPQPGTSQAEQALSPQLGQAAAETSVANSAMTLSQLNRLPTVVGDAGITAAEGFRSGRLGARTEMLGNIRQTRSEAAAALREQNLDLLGKQLSSQTSLTKTKIGSADKALDRQTKTEIAAAQLDARAQLARENNNTKLAIALEKQAAKRRETASKKKAGLSKSEAASWSKRLQKELNDQTNSKGVVTKPARDSIAVAKEMRATGVPLWQALKLIEGATGEFGSPTQVWNLARGHFGLTDKQARALAKRVTGKYPPPGHGAV